MARRFYTAQQARDLLFELPTDDEQSEDELEGSSDDDQSDRDDGHCDHVPDISAEGSNGELSDSGSDSSTLYQLADPSGLSRTGESDDESDVPSSGTDQADDVSDFVDSDCDEPFWKQSSIANVNKDFDRVQVLPAKPFALEEQPVDFFYRFFDNKVIQLIVDQTNLYARQKKAKHWTDTTAKEITAFLGLLVGFSLHHVPSTEHYWSTDPLFRVPPISNVMPVKRFKKLLQCLHINDNSLMPAKGAANYDKLYKIRPLVEKLNHEFSAQCISTSSQSIDEAMVLFKGRSTLKQYMPMKPTKRGYKVWVRCDAKVGYAFQFDIYTGKADGNQVDVGLGGRVVSQLTQSLQGTDVHIAFDNYFSSHKLMEDLYNDGIYATATVRCNRKDLPDLARQRSNMTRGDFKWRSREHTTYIRWKDTKNVHILTTAFHQSAVEVNRKKKDGSVLKVSCPLAIREYTKRMGGVDRFDQRRQVYSVSRRSRRWWLRLFYFLLDASLVNAHILYTSVHVEEPINQLEFRKHVFLGLVSNFTSRRRASGAVNFLQRRRHKKDNKPAGVPDNIRLGGVGIHLPEKTAKFRRCRQCSSRINNKRSRYQCKVCLVPLCIEPCFSRFHCK